MTSPLPPSASTGRLYRIWPVTFTPSPGPARLNADRTPSVISAVLVDYVDADGAEVEVCRVTTSGKADLVTEIELLREAKKNAIAHLKTHPTDPMKLELTSVPASIIKKLEAAEFRDYCREMGANS